MKLCESVKNDFFKDIYFYFLVLFCIIYNCTMSAVNPFRVLYYFKYSHGW